jgi:hypothetical protein
MVLIILPYDLITLYIVVVNKNYSKMKKKNSRVLAYNFYNLFSKRTVNLGLVANTVYTDVYALLRLDFFFFSNCCPCTCHHFLIPTVLFSPDGAQNIPSLS